MDEGFNVILQAVESGEIPENRINQSLERIAGVKSLANNSPAFDQTRLDELSEETAKLNVKLNYSYGG
jgi:hypothetical protein